MQQLVREKGQAAVADALLPKLVGDTTRRERPDVIEHLRRQITSNSVESIAGALDALMTRPDSTPTLGTIHCPVQILVGDEDAITPPALSEHCPERSRVAALLWQHVGSGAEGAIREPPLNLHRLVPTL